ncbi:alpha/beta-hydrolase [Aaosphaeria arxii CBS 175.79]|uniref:Alpha/beta-hydrolase n=1 Tax=Aaosphaeria arxii CBS 175.79 TaxID=1450172 RepID=A0A6A5XPF8_9PLEO|nr:alpha/beta-hydrolase [Aaosphaeria arxii CBS 175.79]KAF2014234.1 alpha/beta-hydrolase [Aaosphaeria arxii CBS 175.79]
MSGLYDAIVIPLVCISGLWIPITLLCCIPWVQKQMLYLHWVTMWPGKWLKEPERAGYLKNQVSPFWISAVDGERLFAWLVAPLGVYSKHADGFIQEPSGSDIDIEERLAFRLLRDDPEARLLIYFHGNSATIAQGRRTEEYRMYSSGASDKIFVLAFDYRGFGISKGTPSESGLLGDAEAVVEWALKVACIPPNRIVLLGHSLGTAVASGIVHRYSGLDSPVQFAGLILCAAFTDSGNAFSSYSIADVIPVLAPVKMIPALQRWFNHRMRDTWKTKERLVMLVQQLSAFNLILVHAVDDGTMPYSHTEELFKATTRAVADDNPSDQEIDKRLKIIDLGEAGRQEVWKSSGISISKLIAKHGGHNTTMKWGPISLAVLECFNLANLHAQ